MNNVILSSKVVYKFETSSKDLTTIRKALLLLKNKDAQDLYDRLTTGAITANKVLQQHFESLVVIETKEELEKPDSP